MKKVDMKKRLAGSAKRYRLSAIYAFGSKAVEVSDLIRGKSVSQKKSEADADIAVLPKNGIVLTAREKVLLTLEIEDILNTGRVDLVVLSEAGPFLAVNAIRGERIYCEDHYRADEYELYVLRRAGDLIMFERERIGMILGNNR